MQVKRTIIGTSGIAVAVLGLSGCGGSDGVAGSAAPSKAVIASTSSPTGVSSPTSSAGASTTSSKVGGASSGQKPVATVTKTAMPTSSSTCSSRPKAQEVDAKIAEVPTDSTAGNQPWTVDPTLDGYRPCAPLSFVGLSFQGATGHSVEPIMLFHDGSYIGTATLKPYAIKDAHQASDVAVTVEYSDDDHQGHTTTFQYAAGRVLMKGYDPANGMG